MHAALRTGVRKIVHVSTVMAYGFPSRMPFDAASAPGPHMSDYARSKHDGDEAARRWKAFRERADAPGGERSAAHDLRLRMNAVAAPAALVPFAFRGLERGVVLVTADMLRAP